MRDAQYVCDPQGPVCTCLEDATIDGAEFCCDCVAVYARHVTCNGCGRRLVRIDVDTSEILEPRAVA